MEYYDLDNFPSAMPQADPETARAPITKKSGLFSFGLTFVIMMGAWVLLSGRFDAFHLGLGVISSALVAYYSRDLLFEGNLVPDRSGRVGMGMFRYIPWLLWQIVLANVHVLKLAFKSDIESHLDPHIIRLDTRLKSDLALVVYANSITLTPGTITIYAASDGFVTIHALDRTVGDENALRDMEEQILKAFGEN